MDVVKGVRRPPVRTQWLALSGALVVLAGVLVAWEVGAAGRRIDVVQLIRPVAAGTALESADLGITAVAFDGSVDGLVPASSLEALTGRVASVDLSAGVLLQRGMWSDQPILGDGERSVGAVLAAGRFPSGLRPGDLVEVASLDSVGVDALGVDGGTQMPPADDDAIDDDAIDDDPADTDARDDVAAQMSIAARVLTVVDLDGGAVSVTLAVDGTRAIDVAIAAALDQLVVVGLPIGSLP